MGKKKGIQMTREEKGLHRAIVDEYATMHNVGWRQAYRKLKKEGIEKGLIESVLAKGGVCERGKYKWVKGRKLSKEVTKKIMDAAILLERAWGGEEFKKRMAILYDTGVEEIESILESKVFIRMRMRADREFLMIDDDVAVLKMAKQFLLNPSTKDAALNKLLENVNEIIRQKGTNKVWRLKSVGDKEDKTLKTYEIGEE